jgi:nitroreductase
LVEQLASAGAALGYALLAANLLGYGAMAVSGHKLRTRVLREAFGLGASEDLLCFVAIGTPEHVKPARPTVDDLSGLLRSWP